MATNKTNKDKRNRDDSSDESFVNTPATKKQSKVTSYVKQNSQRGESGPSLADLWERLDGMERRIEERVERVEERVRAALREEFEVLREELWLVRDENKKLKEEMSSIKKELIDLEQYGRRNNVRIFGLKEITHEKDSSQTEEAVIRLFKEKLSVTTTPQQIEVAHRIGKQSSGRTRQIIVRFVSRKDCGRVLAARKALKGSGITIAEDLTEKNAKWLHSVKKREDVVAAWTKNGKCFYKNG